MDVHIQSLISLVRIPEHDSGGQTQLRLCVDALETHRLHRDETLTRNKLRTVVTVATVDCVDELIKDFLTNGYLGVQPKSKTPKRQKFDARMSMLSEEGDVLLAEYLPRAIEALYTLLIKRLPPPDPAFRIEDCRVSAMMAYLADVNLQTGCYIEECLDIAHKLKKK